MADIYLISELYHHGSKSTWEMPATRHCESRISVRYQIFYVAKADFFRFRHSKGDIYLDSIGGRLFI